ncbi:MAG: site-2 protease family protein [Planctomycetota bacterium]
MSEQQQNPKSPVGKYLPLAVLIAALTATYMILSDNAGKSASVLLALVGLGVVIFVHEFGHFIFAKLADIHVRAFSIGMGPVLLGVRRTEKGFRIRFLPIFFPKNDDPEGNGLLSFTVGKCRKAGETEYRISLIPFGGFVAMVGQEDIGGPEATDDPRSYANKGAGARIRVLAAGVTFNVIFAILLFVSIFLIGIDFPAPVVGGLRPGSPAEAAGIEPGDEVIEIAGKTNIDFSDIATSAALSSPGKHIPLTIKHPDGTIKQLGIAADVPTDKGTDLRIFGIFPAYTLTVAAVTEPNAVSETLGLLPGDVVTAADGSKVDYSWQFDEEIAKALKPQITVTARRTAENGSVTVDSKPIPLEMTAFKDDFKAGYKLSHICSIVPRLKIIAVMPKVPSFHKVLITKLRKFTQPQTVQSDIEETLKPGDIILAVADANTPTFSKLREVTALYEDRLLPIKVLRIDPNGGEHVLTVNVEPERPSGGSRALIGIHVLADAQHPVAAGTIPTDTNLPVLEIPPGATITAVDDRAVDDFYQVISILRENIGQQVAIDYRFNDETTGQVVFVVPAGPDAITVETIAAVDIPFKVMMRTYKAANPLDATILGFRRAGSWMAHSYMMLRRLLSGQISPRNLMGPIGIIALSAQVIRQQEWLNYFYFLAMINVLIAVFNALPLPVFDGGNIVLLVVEKIKGSPLSRKTQSIISYVGLAFIIALAVYITRIDIMRIFFQ